jgi:hypothetical protein
MTKPEHDLPGAETAKGGENVDPAEREPTHDGAPHDTQAREPLGPLTPDADTPLGDTPEAHDEISPHDLPKDHPGRQAAEAQAARNGGTTQGDL